MKKVCIDAGHYGKYNRCPANSAYYESEMAWKLSNLQKKYLEQLGIQVVLTREDASKDLSLSSRGTKSAGCDLFISNHSNAIGGAMNEKVDYVAVYHLTDDTKVTCDDVSKEVANKLAPVIANTMGILEFKVLSRLSDNDKDKDGVLNDNYYGVLSASRKVGTPGLILEHSFHTNSKSVVWLLKDANLDKLAKAEAECIASYLLGKKVNVVSNTQAVVTPSLVSKIYRVQVGAFSKKENALSLLDKLRSAGFEPLLVQLNGIYKIQIGAYSIKTNAESMQSKVNKAGFESFITTAGGSIVSTKSSLKSITEIAKEVIAGKWGNGVKRSNALQKAGYDPKEVQAKVKELM